VEAIGLSPEQFKELLSEIRGPRDDKAAAGVGAPEPHRSGFAWGPGLEGPIGLGVQKMLEAGSPRLALAKCLGVPLAPYIINVRATFPDVDTPSVPNVGSDVKIVQDTLVDSMIARVLVDQTPNNIFQPQSNFFFNFQSGIEATLDVKGAPRYAVADNFTPLSNLADVINGNAKWPAGWILTYQQQLFMSFNNRIAPFPVAPITVVCTFRGWVPVGEMFVQMTNREAFQRLAEAGVCTSQQYQDVWIPR
jgi:hypothetical protein